MTGSIRPTKGLALLVAVLFALGGCKTPPPSYEAFMPTVRGPLFEYPWFRDQPAGIAISPGGRIFVSFPRWEKDPLYSVAEISSDGSLRPYPDAMWNKSRFICVHGIFADNRGNLWILDSASPFFKGVVKGGAKLVKVNLAENRVENIITFDAATVLRQSYLNDLRIDNDSHVAYITDSGTGAIIVTDLSTGTSRRLLAGDPSTMAEAGYMPAVDGKPLTPGKVPASLLNASGIALDSEGRYLYYHALMARNLYRIDTEFLRDPRFPPGKLGEKVEKVKSTGAAEGMLMAEGDNLYIALPEEKAIKRLSPEGSLTTIVQDPRIHWPERMGMSPDSYLYFTDPQINLMPPFNAGTDKRVSPYRLFKILLPRNWE